VGSFFEVLADDCGKIGRFSFKAGTMPGFLCSSIGEKERPMKKIILVATGLMFATSAFAQSTSEKTGVNSLAGIAPKTADFVLEAASSDMFEIQASQMALDHADGVTKSFAQQMIKDHQKTTADLKHLVDGGKVQATLPTSMAPAQQKMLDKLKALKGKKFTKQYRSDQVGAHKDAVDLFKRYGQKGDNADLKAWASRTEPTLEHHLQMARDLNKKPA
jgi:putative membrane protein